jgi:uncharacterized protein involved in type VI secretion and phage assembly
MTSPSYRNRVADLRVPTGLGGHGHGVLPALVTDTDDPDNQGRVKVKLPSISNPDGGAYEAWARIATLMSSSQRGSWFVPNVQDEVLVAFMFGDLAYPFVLGALWSGNDQPPEVTEKVLRSRNGVKVTLDDQAGQEKFIVETPGGQKLTLHDGAGSVELVDSSGNSIKLESSGITINASAKVSVRASQVEVAAGMVEIDASITKFSGIVQCDTLVATTVMGASYSPGAGNIW